MKAEDVQKELRAHASAERKKAVEWYFKTGKGQYGEGDIFIGVSTPDARRISLKYRSLPFEELQKLIASPIHEERSCALTILVQQYEKGGDRKAVLDFYLRNRQYVNNWDLVDCSASKILGRAIHDGLQDVAILDRLVVSDILWERRIAIISTLYFIQKGQLEHVFRLSEKLLGDDQDLMHKAVGWMLREAWKKDATATEAFLIRHYPQVPRTALRYAIERMEEGKRKQFLKGVF